MLGYSPVSRENNTRHAAAPRMRCCYIATHYQASPLAPPRFGPCSRGLFSRVGITMRFCLKRRPHRRMTQTRRGCTQPKNTPHMQQHWLRILTTTAQRLETLNPKPSIVLGASRKDRQSKDTQTTESVTPPHVTVQCTSASGVGRAHAPLYLSAGKNCNSVFCHACQL